MEVTRATQVTAEILEQVDEMFAFKEWNAEQKTRSVNVKYKIVNAVLAIIDNVPPSADRSAAIRKIREALMDCNSAISHGGKF